MAMLTVEPYFQCQTSNLWTGDVSVHKLCSEAAKLLGPNKNGFKFFFLLLLNLSDSKVEVSRSRRGYNNDRKLHSTAVDV